MTTRVALLRGINVGRANRAPMAELRELAASLGFDRVATHLQSGNLLYTSEAPVDADRQRLSAALVERYGFEVPVVVTDGPRLARILEEHPFAEGEPKSVHVGFASGILPDALEAELRGLAREGERFEVRDDLLFADYGGSVHDSKAGNALARLVKPLFVTQRNLATVRALAAKVA